MAPSGSCATDESHLCCSIRGNESPMPRPGRADGSLLRGGGFSEARLQPVRCAWVQRYCCWFGERLIRLATILRCVPTTCTICSARRALDSFDSSLQMRLAQRAMEDAQPQQAEAALRRAVQANPADPAARQALLRLLIDQDRFDEAFDLTEASLKYTPKDANLLVNRGFLALRRGYRRPGRRELGQGPCRGPEPNAGAFVISRTNWTGRARHKLRRHTTTRFSRELRGKGTRSSCTGQNYRHCAAHGGLPGAFLANGTGRSVLSLGGEACRADRPEQARKRGGCERGCAAGEGRQVDCRIAALPAGAAAGQFERRQQRQRCKTGCSTAAFSMMRDFPHGWRMLAS